MQENPVFIKVLLWIGIVLFLLWFLAFSIAPERTLPALGLSEHHGFIPRLYGIFQLSWAILFFFALKDIEKNMAIINGALITGALVIIFLVVCSIIKSGWYLLLGAALLLVYTVLLFLCKPRPARP
jgi:inner membrane protein involved in colicin E2 resistance